MNFRSVAVPLALIVTVIVALLVLAAAKVMRPPSSSRVSEEQSSPSPPGANDSLLTASPCARALAEQAVCAAANKRALEIMNGRGVVAVTVVQDVRTGALTAFAASQPSQVDVITPVSPLSLSKLPLAASWWDNRLPDSSFDSTKGKADAQNPAFRSRVTIHEMLVGGSDSAGRQAAIALREAVGTKKALEDLARYGFGEQTGLSRDEKFWGEVAPAWKERLIPASAFVSLSEQTNNADWAETLSLGEINMSVTALHVSRFLQAVGNDGMLLTPIAREAVAMNPAHGQTNTSIRIIQESTAHKLQSAMRDTVQRGTAESIARVIQNSGWQIGGKTGSGPAMQPRGVQHDGWFAGLIFDPQGKARFTVATFVRSGGYGAGHAANISAELARYLIRG